MRSWPGRWRWGANPTPFRRSTSCCVPLPLACRPSGRTTSPMRPRSTVDFGRGSLIRSKPSPFGPGCAKRLPPCHRSNHEGDPMTEVPPVILRAHAEQARADELEALARLDEKQRPPGWRLSPWAVVTFVMGGKLKDGTEITPKYIGDRRLVEIAVATLATDRALLLLGVPGTAKSWLSEHLAAAISGD